MTTTHARSTVISSLDSVKMEDRKRSLAVDLDDLAPSRKRIVKDENGQAMRMESGEKEVESFQKDAILRQMKEYRRLSKDYESQFRDLEKRCQYHDDHLRTIDAWFAQLLDEVRLLAAQHLPTPPPSTTSATGDELYGSALLFDSNEKFSEHLKARSANISSAIVDLFGRLPSASPDVEALRKQLNDLLANEKQHQVELRTALDQQQSLEERLEHASYRYMSAEKKLDRVRSAQIQKLERQATAGGGEAASPTVGKKGGTPKVENFEVNGDHTNGTASAELEADRNAAIVAAEKQKSQLEEIEVENERLTNELSAARTKLVSLSDDDYAATLLFKGLRSQYDDVIKRVNDLEATNVQLREEAQKLHAERTAYRVLVDEENRVQISETEASTARAETDLARIRNGRDEVLAELNIRKSGDDNRKASANSARELAEARDAKIKALESHVDRLQLQLGDTEPSGNTTNLDDLDLEALKLKARTLEAQYNLLSNELPSMELAWKKTQALASKKVEKETLDEERFAQLTAEKSKAEQKYFAAMKAKDMREGEFRALKSQNARSSEIITQMKETESKTRELVVNQERQIAETKESLSKLQLLYRSSESKSKEAGITNESHKKQIDDLTTIISTKDKEILAAAKRKREAEEEAEKCKSRLEDTKVQMEVMRKNHAAHGDNDPEDDWRKLAICTVCNHNIRNVALKLCGHTFCRGCVETLISNRSRKCPSCGKPFGSGDKIDIVLA
nr:e3 ubiquitin-protein ligase bre1 [Quercus suber]